MVSLGGFEHGDYALACRRLDGEAGIAALELNVSCPNVKSGCISIGSDPAETEAVVRLCRAATHLPLWVKLSPNVADTAAIAAAAERGGADALVLTNTLRGLAIDHRDAAAVAGRRHGRPLGPGAEARRAGGRARLPRCLRPPDRRGGGDRTWVGRARYLAAGASAVQVGSAAFREPLLARRVPRGTRDPTRGTGLRARLRR